MKPREVSLNGRTSLTQGSPLAKQSRARNGTRVHQRSTSAEAAKYIDHLESQLVAVNTKLDSLMSPTSHKARAAKLRALTSEARVLREQVLEWEQHFDERVKDERKQLANVEMALTGRLQSLEDELEAKDSRVKDLEWELESLKTRVKHAEGLEAVNTDLERRIDLLSSLLVQSPTKLDLCSVSSSPSRAEPYRRLSRPRSMLPRVPPSPGSLRLSVNTASDGQYRRSRRSIASPTSTSPSSAAIFAFPGRQDNLPSTDGMKESKDSSASGSGSSSSFRSPPSSSSRPTSLYSNSSFGAYSWGPPLSPEAEVQAKANQKQRHMRRFPSGASCLKPLILPTATGTPSLPISASAHDSSGDNPHRDFSDTSFDPTVTFLTKHEARSPVTTPTQRSRRPSAPLTRAEALCALEGSPNSLTSNGSSHAMLSPRSPSDEPLETVEEETFVPFSPHRERPRSLGEELEEVGLILRNSFDDGVDPSADQYGEQNTAIKTSQMTGDSPRSKTPDQRRARAEPIDPGATPKNCLSPAHRAAGSPKSKASTFVTSPEVCGLLSRIRCLVLETKQSPSALAQRLVYNAWAIGSARLGGLGWWLLGLIYGTRWRRGKRVTDEKTTVAEVPGGSPNQQKVSPGTSELGSSLRLEGNEDPRYGGGRQADVASSRARHNIARSPQLPLPETKSHLGPCPECREPATRCSFRLWLRFSLAIVLAVGLAIKDGPGVLLEERPEVDNKQHEGVC